ncbi:unnamed protein product [Ostreobium quekettii]|uniref:Uncharacterized protein n=1 Tax=Ostreobium quekettii TaxID=121088 RepID=A0A8S1J1F0_9CHLO|nr:unnamed protein product [Ostreobium quekettii]
MKGKVQEIPFRRHYKWILIFSLIATAVLLTPTLLPKWLGFTWASAGSLCTGRAEKLEEIQQTIRELSNLDEAERQVEDSENDLLRISVIAEIQYEDWPDGCTQQDFLNTIDEAKNRECREKKCKWGFSLFGGLNCVTVDVPCSTAEALKLSDAWQEYEVFQSRRAINPNISTEEYQVLVREEGQQIIKRLLWQVDVASQFYIVYIIVGLIIAAPLFVYRPSFKSKYLGTSLSINKPLWVVIVIVVWSTYEAIWGAVRNTDWRFWWASFVADPCLIDASFAGRRIQAITEACNDIGRLKYSYENATFGIQDVTANARVYSACGKETPLIEEFNSASERWDGVEFVGVCNVTELNEGTGGQGTDIDLFGVLLGTGFVAQLMFKVVVIQLLYHLIGFIEPLCTNSGQVELFGEEEYDEDEIRNLIEFKRDSHRVPLAFYTLLFLLVFINVIYAAV